MDESRRHYLRSYFRANIEDPTQYDLTINTSIDAEKMAEGLKLL